MQLPFKVDLTGRVCVVTGGGGVLGGEMAHAIAACGAKVAVLSRKQENADNVARRITDAGHVALPLACNVTRHDQLLASAQKVESDLGPCDILINAAGGNAPAGTASASYLTPDMLEHQNEDSPEHFFDLDPLAMQQLIDVNFTGTVLACHVWGRGMAERGRGSIINISSMAARTPLTRIAMYSSAKAGVDNFTQWLGVHLAKTGVRVNALAPGFFITHQNRAIMLDEDGRPTPRGQTILDHTPMARYGEPRELLGALLWLLSDDAAGFVTGTIVPIDGGFHAHAGV